MHNRSLLLVSEYLVNKPSSDSNNKNDNKSNNNGSDDHLNNFYFIPISSIMAISIVGFLILLIAILKLMYNSVDQYMVVNKYDLIMFKTPVQQTNNIGMSGAKHSGSLNNMSINHQNNNANNNSNNTNNVAKILFNAKTAVYEHNLKAARDSGFDYKLLLAPNSSSLRNKLHI